MLFVFQEISGFFHSSDNTDLPARVCTENRKTRIIQKCLLNRKNEPFSDLNWFHPKIIKLMRGFERTVVRQMKSTGEEHTMSIFFIIQESVLKVYNQKSKVQKSITYTYISNKDLVVTNEFCIFFSCIIAC